jgi:hypothetical protein
VKTIRRPEDDLNSILKEEALDMQSLYLKVASNGSTEVHDLPLVIIPRSGIIDPEPYRRRARGEGPLHAEKIAGAEAVRTLHLQNGSEIALTQDQSRALTFVISGQLNFTASNGEERALLPGDVFLYEGTTGQHSRFWSNGELRLIQTFVNKDWPEPEAKPTVAGTLSPSCSPQPNLKRMYKGADDRSYFRGFDELFAEGQSGWSQPRKVVGLRFFGLEDGTFIDWHPEVVNVLVIGLSGELELEVAGGTGGIEIFRAGDVCLAADRTGEGHIDRARGLTLLATLVMEDEDLW